MKEVKAMVKTFFFSLPLLVAGGITGSVAGLIASLVTQGGYDFGIVVPFLAGGVLLSGIAAVIEICRMVRKGEYKI